MLHVAMCMAENTYSIPASGNGNKRCAIAIERCVRREFSAVNHSNVHSESGCTATVPNLGKTSNRFCVVLQRTIWEGI